MKFAITRVNYLSDTCSTITTGIRYAGEWCFVGYGNVGFTDIDFKRLNYTMRKLKKI